MGSWARTVSKLVEAAEQAASCAAMLLRLERASRRVTRKDFCDALYHLDQLGIVRVNVHRVELERILLAAIADSADEELEDEGFLALEDGRFGQR
jgi:hypothetical protein